MNENDEPISPLTELAMVVEELRRLQNSVRLAQRNAWDDGHEACKRGEQRFRNPFRAEGVSA